MFSHNALGDSIHVSSQMKNLTHTVGQKKYLVSHQLCKFSHLKRWERPVIFILKKYRPLHALKVGKPAKSAVYQILVPPTVVISQWRIFFNCKRTYQFCHLLTPLYQYTPLYLINHSSFLDTVERAIIVLVVHTANLRQDRPAHILNYVSQQLITHNAALFPTVQAEMDLVTISIL